MEVLRNSRSEAAGKEKTVALIVVGLVDRKAEELNAEYDPPSYRC